MLVIFPFEEELYRNAGVPVEFVGHPLVDLVRPAPARGTFLREIGLEPGRPVLAVLPGSREREVGLNLPPLADAVRRLAAQDASLQFLVAAAPALERDRLDAAFAGTPARVLEGRTHAALGAADLGLVASGTATVEAALLGTPMLVVYRVSLPTYLLGRPFVSVPHFAMANLIAGRRVVTELIQGDFTGERVAAEATALLRDAARRERIREELGEVRRRLGAPGASARAAHAVVDVFRRATLRASS
jgi:lipid-A-disaccharide synthase